MAQNHHDTPKQSSLQTQLMITSFRWPNGRRTPLRGRKLRTIRLGGSGGGGRNKPRRGIWLMRMVSKMRLKWLKLHYLRMLRRLKQYYRGLVKDVIEAGATIEAYQQRVLMESTFVVPAMGISFSSFPSVAGSDRHRSIYM